MKKIHFLLSLTLVFLFTGCSDEETLPVITEGNGQYGTPFANVPELQDMVVYEVNVRAFSEAGNLQGVISRLDEIKSLGVNVIWLMPIHPVGEVNSVNSPYCVKNYKEIGAEYGTLQDLRDLTNQAHDKGMAVILDWVANHTAWDNNWISNTSWYTQDSNGNIIIPEGTNWTDVADLNYDNTAMREAMTDAMEHWVLKANIDGFRCDYADGIPFDFWQEAITELNTIPGHDLIFLAEGSRADHYTAGFDMIYGWDFYTVLTEVFNDEPADDLYSINVAEYNSVPAGKEILRYTTNHDKSAWEETPITLYNGVQGALAASVATIFGNGVPLLYSGQEVGRSSLLPFFSNSPINWNDNPQMLSDYKNIMQGYTTLDAARKGVLTDYSSPDVVCFTRILGSQEVTVIVNVRNTAVDFMLPAQLQNTTLNNTLTDASVLLGTSVSLNSYEYLILEN